VVALNTLLGFVLVIALILLVLALPIWALFFRRR